MGKTCWEYFTNDCVSPFNDVLIAFDLVPINTLEFCEGSEYTNVPYSGSKETLIDYMCIQTSAVGDVLSCAILDDSAINVSTHRPITCSIRFSFKPISQPPNQTPYINWRNVKQQSIDKYRRFIENDVNIKQNSSIKY